MKKKIAILSFITPCFIFAAFFGIHAGKAGEKAGRASGTSLKDGVRRTVVAEVVALDVPFQINRLGAAMPTGMVYALRRDVRLKPGKDTWEAGNVMLASYKRPRPIVLRANVGDILEIRFTNWLQKNTPANMNKVGAHVMGLDLVETRDGEGNPIGGINSDATWVGKNEGKFGSLAAQNETRVYRYYAKAEGVYLIRDGISIGPGQNEGRQIHGLFGNVVVQPQGAEWYRSQVTRGDMFYATLRSHALPDNMRLTPVPGGKKVKLLDEYNLKTSEEGIFVLTTFKSRRKLRAIKTAKVVIRKQKDVLYLQKEERAEETEDRGDIPPGRVYTLEPGYGEREGEIVRAHPVINYQYAVYPAKMDMNGRHFRPEGTPVLDMLQARAVDNDGNPPDKPTGSPPPIGEEDLGKYEDALKEYGQQIWSLDTGAVPDRVRGWLEEAAKGELRDDATASGEPFPDWWDRYKGSTGWRWAISGQVTKGEDWENRTFILDAVRNAQDQVTVHIYNGQLRLIGTDLTAIITGPNAGRFPYSNTSPTFSENPATPDRRQPYREFNIGYHNSVTTQAFPILDNGAYTAGQDQFGINYGFGGIGAEIVANRLGVGPEGVNGDEVDLKFEEFFLSSWAVGDPAMLVDNYANGAGSLVPDFDVPGARSKEKGEALRLAASRKDDMMIPEDSAEAARAEERLNNRLLPESSSKSKSRHHELLFGHSEAEEKKPKRATKVFFPDDPSNVYHSYMRDHCKMRIYNAGSGAPHVHHLHAHQWLHSPNNDNGHYLDSQMITAGVGYTLEITYNGAGNRNQTVGDSIFHCHFYPHFARGMWSLWRVHDVFEEGTILDENRRVVGSRNPFTGEPNEDFKGYNRALPDGEIFNGSPIPALVPLPTLGMAPLPAYVGLGRLADSAGGEYEDVINAEVPNLDNSWGRITKVYPEKDKNDKDKVRKVWRDGKEVTELVYRNPGFPFFIPGVAGHRAPHPPLDFGWEEDEDGNPVYDDDGNKVLLDGGLPRHLPLGGKTVREFHTRWDFTKDFVLYDDETDKRNRKAIDGGLIAVELPEEGTPIEKVAMRAHAQRTYATSQPNGDAGNFILNGLPPQHGAPYADPGIDDDGNAVFDTRRYKGAVIQKDVVLNKEGWHYPQQRFITLWGDIADTFSGERPPEPFFFRAHTGETIEFWHCNLVPDYYDLDDFQVRTPTDILGQHIHLVKFDVTSSDGAGNGFNYEDGTFSPDEVRVRIDAMNVKRGNTGPTFYTYSREGFVNWKEVARKKDLVAKEPKFLGDAAASAPEEQNWNGAQVTIQRWATDPLLDNAGKDRTLRTVFTHDHYGPSTHQQIGLYAGLLIEPQNSIWRDPVDGHLLYDLTKRNDGGPTSWQAIIEMPNRDESYREFALEFQDLQLAYTAESTGHLREMEEVELAGAQPSLFNFKPRPALLGGLPVPPGIITAFAREGIALGASATVTYTGPAVPPGQAQLGPWEITSGDKTYKVTDNRDGGQPNQFEVTGDAEFDIVYQLVPAGGPLPTGTYAAFKQNGITFSENATYAAIAGQANTYKVIDPDGYPGYDYAAHPPFIMQGAGGTGGFNVFTPVLETWADPAHAINVQNKGTLGPTLVSQQATVATYSLNYRNEPLPSRVQGGDPNKPEGDLAYVYASIDRANDRLNAQPKQGAPISPDSPFQYPAPLLPESDSPQNGGVTPTDPYTPLLRAYENDKVEIRTLVGAHTTTHAFDIQRVKWLFEPSANNSGFRAAQGMGLSEHFEMIFTLPPASTSDGMPFSDYLYRASAGTIGQSSGLWGIMRAYRDKVPKLVPLPTSANPRVGDKAVPFPAPKADQEYTIYATDPKGGIVYNSRGQMLTRNPLEFAEDQKIQVGRGLVYTLTDPAQGNVDASEPLILRANAGDWIKVTLVNKISDNYNVPDFPAPPPYRQLTNPPNQALPLVSLHVPTEVGIRPQLLAYDGNSPASGLNIGYHNKDITVPRGDKRTFWWYAGDLSIDNKTGKLVEKPMEFGAVNLFPADPLQQHRMGLIGTLIVEPEGSQWPKNGGSSVKVTLRDGTHFQELVAVLQDDIPFKSFNQDGPIKKGGFPSATTVKVDGNPNDMGIPNQQWAFAFGRRPPWAINYRSEHLLYRSPRMSPVTDKDGNPVKDANGRLEVADSPQPIDRTMLLSNKMVGTIDTDPQTPVFEVNAGDPVRFRVLFPAGRGDNTNKAIELDGHSWQEEPWQAGSSRQGFNPKSQTFGSQFIVPSQPLNLLLESAGGARKVKGDYLFSTYMRTVNGSWCIMRVK